MICAWFRPEVSFASDEKMEPTTGLLRIPPESFVKVVGLGIRNNFTLQNISSSSLSSNSCLGEITLYRHVLFANWSMVLVYNVASVLLIFMPCVL